MNMMRRKVTWQDRRKARGLKNLFDAGFDPNQPRDLKGMWTAKGDPLDYSDFTPPTKTVKAYKLFRTLKSRPGEIFPTQVGITQSVPMGVWVPAEYIPTPGFKERPGWHGGTAPLAPQMRNKQGYKQDHLVWGEVEFEADDHEAIQAAANEQPDRMLGKTIPKGGYYKFHPGHKNYRDSWVISGAMKVKRLLSDDEVYKILMKAGYPEDAKREAPHHKTHDAYVTVIEDYSPDQPRDYHGRWTNNKNFKKWFGNSKVVDKEGKPLVALRGSLKDREYYDPIPVKFNKRWKNKAYMGDLGTWFVTPSLRRGNYDEGNAEFVAESFTENPKYDYTDKTQEFQTGAHVVLAYLSIQNPKEYEDFDDLIFDRWGDKYDGLKTKEEAADFRNRLIREGYDGIVVRNSMTDGNVDRDDWVAFYPHQIKSAIGNKGTFDPKSNKITDASSADPSGTGPLQKLFWKDARRRWQDVARAVREGLKTYDFVGVGDRVTPFQNWLDSLMAQHVMGSGAWMQSYLKRSAEMAKTRATSLVQVNDYDPDQPRDEYGRWVDKIKGALTPDLLKPEYREENACNPMFGHCYAASEALYHLMGGQKSGYVPHHGKDERGITHWWLQNKEGKILDPTAEQYTSVGKKPPYDVGVGGGYLTREPSKRATEIIRRVKHTKDADIDMMRVVQDATVSELQGIMQATSQQAVRAMSQCIMRRKDPTADIIKILSKVGEARTKMLVNHSIMKAFTVATLEAFRAAGHTHVSIIPEKVPHIHDAGFNPDQERDDHGRWFAGSKAVDEKGNPLTVYRGTLDDLGERSSPDGLIYFSRHAKVAAGGERGFISPEDLKEMGIDPALATVPEGLRVYPANLSIKNPATLEDLKRVAPNEHSMRKALLAAKAAGYDGFMSDYEYVVFNPDQIRSTITHDAARKIPQPRGKGGKFRKFVKPLSRANKRKAEQQYLTLQELGTVNVMTAEDDRVCDTCESIAEEGPYHIDHALSLIPAHINCRCVFVPTRRLPMRDFNPYHEPAGTSIGGQFAHAPGGTSIEAEGASEVGGGEVPPKYKQPDQRVIDVGGDDWNKKMATQLELEYVAAKPALEEIEKNAVGNTVFIKGMPGSWESLSGDQQDATETAWKEDNFNSFLESEIQNWRDNGDAENDAARVVISEYEDGDLLDWTTGSIQQVLDEYEDSIPFTAEQLASAIIVVPGKYDQGAKVDFLDELLDKTDPDFEKQLSLEGIKPERPSDKLPADIKDDIVKYVQRDIDGRIEDTASDIEPPDYLKESASEAVDTVWDEKSDYDKYQDAQNYGIIDEDSEGDNEIEAIPETYNPTQDPGKGGYRETQLMAKYMFQERAQQLIQERLGRDVSASTINTWDNAMWKDWVGSSTSNLGIVIQAGIADEFGSRYRDEHFTDKIGLKPGESSKAYAEMIAKQRIGDEKAYEIVKALLRAKWETTQWMLDKADMPIVNLYRGIGMSDEDILNTRQEEVFVYGHLKGSTAVTRDSFTKLPELHVERNGAASTTHNPDIANNWSGSGDHLIKLRAAVPRTAIISVPAYGQNIHKERESVVMGTAWVGWDAWLNTAPTIEDVPLKEINP